MKRLKSVEDKILSFWNNVDQTGGIESCWLWQKSIFVQTGYGQATNIVELTGSSASVVTTAHRQAWIICNGDPGFYTSPKSGKAITYRVCHRCPSGPNRLCCNPAHLRLGTDQANSDDRNLDGNTYKGELVSIAKMNNQSVRTARYLYENKVANISTLASKFNVAVGTMKLLLHYKTWQHI